MPPFRLINSQNCRQVLFTSLKNEVKSGFMEDLNF